MFNRIFNNLRENFSRIIRFTFFDSINLHELASTDPTKLIQSTALSYARYKFNLYRYNFDSTKIKKVKSPKKKTVQIKFENISGVDGYQVMYSTNKNFKGKVKTKSYSKSYSSSKNLYVDFGKLKSHKAYYFKMRTYYDRNNVRYYSDWSNVKKVKIK